MHIVWNWPQITEAVLICLGLLYKMIKHGEPKKHEIHNFYEWVFYVGIGQALLFFGGFWSNGCAP